MSRFIHLGHIEDINPDLLPLEDKSDWDVFLKAYRAKGVLGIQPHRWTKGAKVKFEEILPVKYIIDDQEIRTTLTQTPNKILTTGSVLYEPEKSRLWFTFSGRSTKSFGVYNLRGYVMDVSESSQLDALIVSMKLTN